jgi:hypothetical protein
MVLSLQQEQAMYMSEKQCLQEMPSSVISAILQEHDNITFIVTSSIDKNLQLNLTTMKPHHMNLLIRLSELS